MKIKLLPKLLIITGLALMFGYNAQAQTLNEAIEAYNNGLDLVETDINAAIESIERSHEIASGLGAEGEDVKVQAEKQIPGLYYEMGVKAYRERNVEQAVGAFQEAIEVSDKFNDENTRSRSESLLHQLYAIQGNAVFREDNNEKALELYNMALEINPQHARSHLGKALVYRRTDDVDLFRESIDKAIETGLSTNEEQIVATAESTARDYFLISALEARKANNLAQAVEYVNASLVYDQSFAESHYMLASIANEQSRFQDAVKSAEKALDLMEGSQDETAKVHFELGKAYEGLGNNSEACAAYTNAAVGQYEASAKYQMEHVLKCQ